MIFVNSYLTGSPGQVHRCVVFIAALAVLTGCAFFVIGMARKSAVLHGGMTRAGFLNCFINGLIIVIVANVRAPPLRFPSPQSLSLVSAFVASIDRGQAADRPLLRAHGNRVKRCGV